MVLAGLITFVLVTAALRDRSATVEVFVAAGPIEAGTPIEGAELGTIAVPADSALLPALVHAGPVEPGLAASRSIGAGQPVLRADLVPSSDGSVLRTVALPVERLVIDGLGLRIGDRVDVIAVDSTGGSRFVVADVGVTRLPEETALGLGRTADTSTTWLTVGVTDRQALDLAGATARGTVVVARSTGATPVDGQASSSLAAAVVVEGPGAAADGVTASGSDTVPGRPADDPAPATEAGE